MPEFERCGGHDGAQFAVLQPRFRVVPQSSRQTSVMRQNGVRPEAFGQRVRDAFRQTPGIDEDQSRALAEDVGGEAIVDLLPHFAGGDRAEFVVGDFDGEDHLARDGRRR